MRSTFSFVLLLLIATPAAFAQSDSLPGFTPASASRQLTTEKQFLAALDTQSIGHVIKDLSALPHHLGSPGSKAVAEKILSKLISFGFDAHIETFRVLFPTPKSRTLELVTGSRYKALLKEPSLAEDATSGQTGQLPTYNAWSADGDITAELVFVNYGLPEDYQQLASMGVDVKGRIVIAKYGRSWRGIKPKVAYEHGAVGCIIYSDPYDDGYTQGDVYPKGSFRNEYGVQRGSVMDMPVYPGDPLTPGVGATESARRLDRADATTIMKIPVLPISYHDAQPLLAALGGQPAPSGWSGSLPITYHIGPGTAKVHLQLAFDWSMVSCYDVIGRVAGAEFPDQWVIRGNHHDAWVNGAEDPISGQASMLEEAKSVGMLLKSGWRPKRTIVYCAWDGEEQALIGSTEWTELHETELKEKAVVYINTDDNGRGFFQAGGSHALTPLINGIAAAVTDPQTGVSARTRLLARMTATAAGTKAKKESVSRKSMELEALGSGSDFSPFLQHVGVPSVNLGFGGESNGGDYHSIYDSYDNFVRFIDPGFAYSAALSKVAGLMTLRMADADELPFDFSYLHTTVDGYMKELITLAQDMRESTAVENELISSGLYQLAADPAKPFVVPATQAPVPYIDFSPLQNAVASLGQCTDSLAVKCSRALASGATAGLNTALYRAEQQLLLTQGLPRRPWYKHVLYAPGLYTGYGVKTLPGIREAMEQRNWKEAQLQIRLAADCINQLSAYLRNIK